MIQLEMAKIRVACRREALPDIPARMAEIMEEAKRQLRPGMRVAICAGSRGISNYALVVKCVVQAVKEAGAEPFIIPAMGSHGGATAEGQARVLADYGITEETMGAPVVSSMEVVRLGELDGEPRIPVYMDAQAYGADGVIVVNRVKLHTDFHGDHESGIVKMLTIGLGKHAQALAVHRYGANGLRDYIPKISRKVIESGKILGGVAILEDGADQTADLVYAPADRMFEVDHALLERSRALVAKLPFQETDVLIVDQIGKNYSGTGMDTNVIGRIMIPGQVDLGPQCRRIVALDISDESHGNALGVGLADVISKRLDDKIEWKSTYENVITSGFLARGNRPIVGDTDKRALEIALMCCGQPITAETARVARIPNTLHIGTLYVSRRLMEEIKDDPAVEQISDFEPIQFDENGSLAPF
jgi:hypothetical protein